MMELRAEHLCKSYDGESVLQGISFTAGEGITCIMAPSGRGKTTLMRILLGLERPDSGSIYVPQGCRWTAVFQEDRLLEQLDAMGNLRFVLGGDMDVTRAENLLCRLGLGDTGTRRVRDFSGGMKRRLSLARALLPPSDALVLDEPFTGLDEENRAAAMECIRQETAGKVVLLVTHEETDAALLGARIVRLQGP